MGQSASSSRNDLESGIKAEAKGDATKARSLYEAAITAEATNHAAEFHLALLLSKQDNALTEALKHARKAVELQPANENYRFNLANMLSRARKAQESRDQYLELLKINPNHAGAHNNLANIFKDKLKDVSKARYHYEEGIRSDPKLSLLRFNYACLLVNDDVRDYETARVHLEEAMQLDPNDLDIIDKLADVYIAKLGLNTQGEILAKKGIEMCNLKGNKDPEMVTRLKLLLKKAFDDMINTPTTILSRLTVASIKSDTHTASNTVSMIAMKKGADGWDEAVSRLAEHLRQSADFCLRFASSKDEVAKLTRQEQASLLFYLHAEENGVPFWKNVHDSMSPTNTIKDWPSLTFIRLLNKALRKLPVVHRATQFVLPSSVVGNLKVGEVFTWTNFVSTTASTELAEQAASYLSQDHATKVTHILVEAKVIDITAVAPYPAELEHILRPLTELEVVRVVPLDDGDTYLHVRQVGKSSEA